MAAGAPLKDQLFNRDKVAWLGARLASAAPGFDAGDFEARVMAELPALELKARIALIARVLAEMLPGDFPRAAAIVEAALPPPLDPTLSDDDFGEFIIAPLGDFAVIAGMEAHRDRALDLLEQVTMRFSAEYAIRHFLNRWPEETMVRLAAWARHPNYHVRRLVSEGTRPRLPWGIGIPQPPGAAMALLDTLHADRTRFVTRSVANHLNDITKSGPDMVLDALRRWQEEARQSEGELAWITAHALRGLVKAGHEGALAMLGYAPAAALSARLALEDAAPCIGGALGLVARVEGPPATPVLVDYAITFHRPSGRPGRKVFKLAKGVLGADGALELRRAHKLHGDATTFRLHPGPHRVTLLVNGREAAEAGFTLEA